MAIKEWRGTWRVLHLLSTVFRPKRHKSKHVDTGFIFFSSLTRLDIFTSSPLSYSYSQYFLIKFCIYSCINSWIIDFNICTHHVGIYVLYFMNMFWLLVTTAPQSHSCTCTHMKVVLAYMQDPVCMCVCVCVWFNHPGNLYLIWRLTHHVFLIAKIEIYFINIFLKNQIKTFHHILPSK